MSNVVISIRGSNGAGKTWVARKVMDRAEQDFVKKVNLSNGVLINVYTKFVIIGSYDRVCGGCDTVKTPGLVWDAVVECAEHSNVIYEGVIVGNVYEPTIILNERLKAIDARLVPISLNTPFEQCVANVNARRAVEGKPPIEKTDNILTNDKKNISSARKLHVAGFNPHWVSAEEAVEVICKELGYV
tara:strand:- start:8239 stop:8799 length:561 start_codon:yes stop_codon:yes gene_type:complete